MNTGGGTIGFSGTAASHRNGGIMRYDIISQILHYKMTINISHLSHTAVQRQTAVAAHFSSEQLLLFAFAWRQQL